MGRKAGLTDEKLLSLCGSDFSVFNARERLVIELADALADTPSNVSDDLYARLSSVFSDEQLLELGAQIAFENYRARLNRVFNVESDELYTPQQVVEHKDPNQESWRPLTETPAPAMPRNGGQDSH